VGLATQIEKGELRSRATEVLLTRHLAPLLDEGADVLVLGCTHYPFVAPMIEQIAMAAGKKIAIVDTGDAVTRQLARLLDQKGLCRQAGDGGTLAAFTTGSRTALKTAFVNLLGERPPVGVVG
jgi:glutamate racemase